jgi:peptidoglycan/xylan/chitin deacetylase (PgdA/CDA1 family)
MAIDPVQTVTTLLPGLSRASVDLVIDSLEARVGNGGHDIPLTLTWPMLRDMQRAGFTIGSHTRRHVSMPTESEDTVTEELDGSKRELERELGATVSHFAYPGGEFTPRDVTALARAGYRYGYTACQHRDPRHPALTMERLLLWEGSSVDADGRFSPAILDCQAHDLWPPVRRCSRVHRA